MKQVIIVLITIVFSNPLFSQVCKPKLESVLTVVQQKEYVELTECLTLFKIRVEGAKLTFPLFKDEEDNLFCVIMKNGHLELVPSEQFNYAQN